MPIVGERVICPFTIGSRKPFTGVIESKYRGKRDIPDCFNVRADDDGQLWSRTAAELRRPNNDG
jgi:hypothetical protein